MSTDASNAATRSGVKISYTDLVQLILSDTSFRQSLVQSSKAGDRKTVEDALASKSIAYDTEMVDNLIAVEWGPIEDVMTVFNEFSNNKLMCC